MNKRFSRILSLAVVLLMCVAMAAPAMAAFNGYTGVNGGNVSVTKYLVLDKDVPVPTTTFNFALRAATEGELSENVMAGIGTPTATYSVEISSTDSKYNTDPSKAELADVDWTEQVVYYDTFNLDFSGVTFTEPGIYRYVLTETAGNIDAMTYDNSTKYVDVYVQNKDGEEGQLEIQGYVIHDAENEGFTYNTTDAGMTVTGKGEGFVNELETYDLTLEKILAGNQANLSNTFPFTIKVTLPTGVADVTYTITTVTDTVTGANSLSTTDGEGEVTVTLGHKAKIKIAGLPKGTKIDISETNGLYVMSYTVNSVNGTMNGTNAITQETMNANKDIVVTNTRTGVIPTGVLLTIAPFAALLAVGLVGVVFILRKKKD